MIRPTDSDLPNVGQLEKDVTAYLRMRTDAVKLGIVESTATIVGKGIALVMVIVLCAIALTAFSVVLVLLIAEWLDSMILGALIVGGLYLIIALIIWLMREKFVDKMVGMFARMIFSTSKEDLS